MGSLRLPNKMLLHLHGYPICEWIFRRVQQAKKIDQLVFALPDTKQDDVLAWYLESIGALVYRGSENNLVERYYQAAKTIDAEVIVRVCADNPLICASEIDRLVVFFSKEPCDYAYNHIPRGNSYPDGLGAEICTMQLLEEIREKVKSEEHREHLFNYVWSNQTDYRIQTFEPAEEIAHPELKLDLDTFADYQYLLENAFQIDMSAVEIVKIALRYNTI